MAGGDHQPRYRPSLQLGRLRGTYLDVGNRPSALLRRPGDVRAIRPVQDEISGRWTPFGIDHEPIRVVAQPSQVAGIVVLEELHHRLGAHQEFESSKQPSHTTSMLGHFLDHDGLVERQAHQPLKVLHHVNRARIAAVEGPQPRGLTAMHNRAAGAVGVAKKLEDLTARAGRIVDEYRRSQRKAIAKLATLLALAGVSQK